MTPKPHPPIHELKTEPVSFEALRKGRKLFELRKDDRGYEVNDLLVLREWDGQYTGRMVTAKVTHIIRAGDVLHGEMLAPGIVAMSVLVPPRTRVI